MDESWCIAGRYEAIMGSANADPSNAALRLWEEGRLSIYYAPFDWVNRRARIMLVGICPGAHQAREALCEAKRRLESGCSFEETLKHADAVGSFSGPMRSNLVSMLDRIGVALALGIDTTRGLFETHHDLAAHVSAIDYPVFVDGKNYRGASPRLTKHPTLAALVTACLGARVMMAPAALVVPLGKCATEAVQYLADRDLLTHERCLFGFPHPSGANGWRVRQFAERRERLKAEVSEWASRPPSADPRKAALVAPRSRLPEGSASPQKRQGALDLRAPAAADIPDQIRKLSELKDDGILTDEEFSAKKPSCLRECEACYSDAFLDARSSSASACVAAASRSSTRMSSSASARSMMAVASIIAAPNVAQAAEPRLSTAARSIGSRLTVSPAAMKRSSSDRRMRTRRLPTRTAGSSPRSIMLRTV
jgi:Short C-terminal domain